MESNENPPQNEADFASQPDRWGRRILISVIVLSLMLAIHLANIYGKSAEHLSQVTDEIATRGEELSTAECLDEVLGWLTRCEAISSLCDQSVSRMMGICLSAQNRITYCEGLGPESGDTGFGNDDCRGRELNRAGKRACGAAYRAIHVHCVELKAAEALEGLLL
jgi:hypothetical protein